MPIADTKKAQTIRNLWHTRVTKKILEADAVVAAIRAAIEGNSLAGQFSGPELTAMQAVESALGTLATLPGITVAAGEYVPNHATEQATVGLEI